MDRKQLVDGQMVTTGSWSASGTVRAFASGDADVEVHASARVWASGRSTVRPFDRSRVMVADDPSLVIVEGSSKALLSGVHGSDQPILVWNEGRVEASGDMSIHAYDDARVVVRGRIAVHLLGRSRAMAFDDADVFVSGSEPRVEAFDRSTIKTSDARYGWSRFRLHDQAQRADI